LMLFVQLRIAPQNPKTPLDHKSIINEVHRLFFFRLF